MRILTLYYVKDEKPGKSILSKTEKSEVQDFYHPDTEEDVFLCVLFL